MRGLIPFYRNDIEKAANDRLRISEMRDNIRQGFSEFFYTQGFSRHSPGQIIPENDESVLFTGSTISTFKPHLIHGTIPENGFYMIQSCLRTQNTKILNDDIKQPQWASYFSSIGALTRYEKLDILSEQSWAFYTDYLRIPRDRMRIRIASKDVDLLKFWNRAGLEDYLEFDANNPIYYTHTFGMDDITGRNCNLAVIDRHTGELRDIGNIICIETKDTQLGAEIAFGVETIVSRLLGFPNPIAASLIADIVPLKNQYSLKLADAISSSMVILDAGVRPVVTNRGRVLRKYMQAISNLRQKADVTIRDIQHYAEEFELREFGSISDLPAKVISYIMRYEELCSQDLTLEKINERVSSIFPPEVQQPVARISVSSHCEPLFKLGENV